MAPPQKIYILKKEYEPPPKCVWLEGGGVLTKTKNMEALIIKSAKKFQESRISIIFLKVSKSLGGGGSGGEGGRC